MKRILIFISLLIVIKTNVVAQVKLSRSDMVKFELKVLESNKAKIAKGDRSLMPAYLQLLKDGDEALSFEPVSVMEKTEFPPSGNKHDYMSIAPYWWPNPAKPNGLPYIRRDGEVNPEVKNFPDKENMPKLVENVYTLSLAYYFSGNEKYASHASKLLQVWFLDTATRMNPNLNFGQAVKGVNPGRAEGLIDTRHFIYLLDGVQLLRASKHWTKENHQQMEKWVSDFLQWMEQSKIGNAECNSKNNHGVWFDAQSLSYALFIGDQERAKKIIERATDRLDKQMGNDGFFPLEMERTTSLHYSVFILNAFCIIAQLSDNTPINFWEVKTASGKSLRQSFEAIFPYIKNEKEWTGQQIRPYEFSDGFPLLLRSAEKYNCGNCNKSVLKLIEKKSEKNLVNLL